MKIDYLCNGIYEDSEAAIIDISIKYDRDNAQSYHIIEQLNFIIECYDWEKISSEKIRRFKIICTKVVESTLTVGYIASINYELNHPLLYKYNLPHTDIYFSSGPQNPYELLGRLTEAHNKIYDNWRPLSDCINGNIIEVLGGGYGLLASGPNVVMNSYFSAVSNLLRLNSIQSDFSKKSHLLLTSTGFIVCEEILVEEL